MPNNLTAIEDALAGLTDIELRALVVASSEVPQAATGRLGWIESACDWEVNRRVGREYDLLPPEAAIDPRAGTARLEVAHALRESFTAGEMAPAVLRFFDALADLLVVNHCPLKSAFRDP